MGYERQLYPNTMEKLPHASRVFELKEQVRKEEAIKLAETKLLVKKLTKLMLPMKIRATIDDFQQEDITSLDADLTEP